MKFILLLCLLFPMAAMASESKLEKEAHDKNISLSKEDRDVLDTGEITTAEYVIGGVLGTYPIGLGLGHVVQHRWKKKGWIFTAGELGSLTVAVIGITGCIKQELTNWDSSHCHGTSANLVAVGVLGYLGFRIWEIVDVWAAPPYQNQRYKELKSKITAEPAVKASLDLVPLVSYQGTGMGLRLRF